MIFDGFFDKGSKLKMDPFTDMDYGYWKEMDENNQLRSVCKVDDQGKRYGTRYFHDCGKISRISDFVDGNEVKVLKEFNGDTMVEYENGVKVYEGGFLDSVEDNYPRYEAGTQYSSDRKSVLYKGMYKYNGSHGIIVSYDNGESSNPEKAKSTKKCTCVDFIIAPTFLFFNIRVCSTVYNEPAFHLSNFIYVFCSASRLY